MTEDRRKRTDSIMTDENESSMNEPDNNFEDGAIPQLDSLRRQLQNFSYQLHDLQKQLPSSSASSFNEERLSSTYEGPLPPPPENYHPPPTHPNLPSVGLHLKMPSTIPVPLDTRSLISESPSISQSTYSHSYHIPVPLYNTLNYPRRKKPILDNISNRNHPVPTPSSRTDSGLRTALPNSPLFPITPVPANPPGSGHICMWELQVCCHETSSKSKDGLRKPKLCNARFATGEKLYQHLVNEHIASEPADRCNFCHWRGCLKIFKNKSRYLRRDHFKKHITDLVELICLDCGRVCEKDYITGKHFCSEKEKAVEPNAEVEVVESSAEEETVVGDNERLDSKVIDTADSLLLTDQQVMTPELLSPEPMAEDIIVPHPNIDPSYMFPSITSSPADGSAQIRQDPETITLLNDLGDSISHLRTEQTTQRQIIDSLSETLQSQIEHRNLPADNLADPEVQKALGYASDIHDTVTLLLQRITEHIGSAAVATASSAENAAEEHRQLADALGNLNSEQANVRTLLEKLSKCEDASAQSLENVRQDLRFGNDIVFDRLEKLEMQLEKVATSTVNLIDRLASDDSTENEPVELDLSSISVLLQPSFDSLHSKLQSLNETLNQSTVSHQSSLMESERRQVEGIIASISPQITDMSDSIQQITMRVFDSSIHSNESIDMIKNSLRQFLHTVESKLDEINASIGALPLATEKIASTLNSVNMSVEELKNQQSNINNSLGILSDKLMNVDGKLSVDSASRETAFSETASQIRSLQQLSTQNNEVIKSKVDCLVSAVKVVSDHVGKTVESNSDLSTSIRDLSKNQSFTHRKLDNIEKKVDSVLENTSSKVSRDEYGSIRLALDNIVKSQGTLQSTVSEMLSSQAEELERGSLQINNVATKIDASAEQYHLAVSQLQSLINSSSLLQREQTSDLLSSVGEILKEILSTHKQAEDRFNAFQTILNEQLNNRDQSNNQLLTCTISQHQDLIMGKVDSLSTQINDVTPTIQIREMSEKLSSLVEVCSAAEWQDKSKSIEEKVESLKTQERENSAEVLDAMNSFVESLSHSFGAVAVDQQRIFAILENLETSLKESNGTEMAVEDVVKHSIASVQKSLSEAISTSSSSLLDMIGDLKCKVDSLVEKDVVLSDHPVISQLESIARSDILSRSAEYESINRVDSKVDDVVLLAKKVDQTVVQLSSSQVDITSRIDVLESKLEHMMTQLPQSLQSMIGSILQQIRRDESEVSGISSDILERLNSIESRLPPTQHSFAQSQSVDFREIMSAISELQSDMNSSRVKEIQTPQTGSLADPFTETSSLHSATSLGTSSGSLLSESQASDVMTVLNSINTKLQNHTEVAPSDIFALDRVISQLSPSNLSVPDSRIKLLLETVKELLDYVVIKVDSVAEDTQHTSARIGFVFEDLASLIDKLDDMGSQTVSKVDLDPIMQLVGDLKIDVESLRTPEEKLSGSNEATHDSGMKLFFEILQRMEVLKTVLERSTTPSEFPADDTFSKFIDPINETLSVLSSKIDRVESDFQLSVANLNALSGNLSKMQGQLSDLVICRDPNTVDLSPVISRLDDIFSAVKANNVVTMENSPRPESNSKIIVDVSSQLRSLDEKVDSLLSSNAQKNDLDRNEGMEDLKRATDRLDRLKIVADEIAVFLKSNESGTLSNQSNVKEMLTEVRSKVGTLDGKLARLLEQKGDVISHCDEKSNRSLKTEDKAFESALSEILSKIDHFENILSDGLSSFTSTSSMDRFIKMIEQSRQTDRPSSSAQSFQAEMSTLLVDVDQTSQIAPSTALLDQRINQLHVSISDLSNTPTTSFPVNDKFADHSPQTTDLSCFLPTPLSTPEGSRNQHSDDFSFQTTNSQTSPARTVVADLPIVNDKMKSNDDKVLNLLQKSSIQLEELTGKVDRLGSSFNKLEEGQMTTNTNMCNIQERLEKVETQVTDGHAPAALTTATEPLESILSELLTRQKSTEEHLLNLLNSERSLRMEQEKQREKEMQFMKVLERERELERESWKKWANGFATNVMTRLEEIEKKSKDLVVEAINELRRVPSYNTLKPNTFSMYSDSGVSSMSESTTFGFPPMQSRHVMKSISNASLTPYRPISVAKPPKALTREPLAELDFEMEAGSEGDPWRRPMAEASTITDPCDERLERESSIDFYEFRRKLVPIVVTGKRSITNLATHFSNRSTPDISYESSPSVTGFNDIKTTDSQPLTTASPQLKDSTTSAVLPPVDADLQPDNSFSFAKVAFFSSRRSPLISSSANISSPLVTRPVVRDTDVEVVTNRSSGTEFEEELEKMMNEEIELKPLDYRSSQVIDEILLRNATDQNGDNKNGDNQNGDIKSKKRKKKRLYRFLSFLKKLFRRKNRRGNKTLKTSN